MRVSFDVLVKDVGVVAENAALLAEMEGLLGTVTTSAVNVADWDYTWAPVTVGLSFGRAQQKSGLAALIEDLFALVGQQAPALDLDVTITFPGS